MKRGAHLLAGGTLAALTLLGGSAVPSPGDPPPGHRPFTPRLVAFDSCAEALNGLRAAARASVGPWGFTDGWRTAFGGLPKAESGARVSAAAAPEHSTTNNHEVGADEPDLVKTDGRRIVTVGRGVLRVVDPAARRETGRVDLARALPDPGWGEQKLLLHGDRALVLTRAGAIREPAMPMPGRRMPEGAAASHLTLVDLAGAPHVLGTYRIEGDLVDARQGGTTARVVVRSRPRLEFPHLRRGTDETRTAANRQVVDRAGVAAWLPAYEWTSGDQRHTGRVGCDRLSRPPAWTGTSMLTVLSFDLAADRLGDGDPVSVAADATTVYGTGTSLYLAGERPTTRRPGSPRWDRRTPTQVTEIYQFDTGAPGRPRYVAAGTVPGSLVNQYALSEWQGHLRVATTTGDPWVARPNSESGVQVLRRDGDTLVRTGSVGGLGPGERIWSVRFLGGSAYVVTFRRTDPLYAVDLTDPAAPRVTGELKITGYSAYLHPLPEGRLLGVGQEADRRGRTQGVQVSLFDVRDPARPTRLDQWHVPRAYSALEYDSHAFLHRPETGLVALPVGDDVRLLRVTGTDISEIGTVSHPGDPGAVTRSLLVGDVLWTVSDAGLRATDPTTARSLDWLPVT
ncbi:Secreted protein containing C-terminal beta-propeller domain [Micromonospora citrea]|uniref:Secreted protein containing C-terminal beta-propeller domain n=1 Tax=Micromonospora citrea TaxID=47855 RepID=A0A1C6V380_9ACTN|nr:beta-propeller domain-containing protein [Micromonospora citrea]SCL60849.1 Secreted protein containing C-terminal beta-propeller domain [Micromonospora citrea]